MAKVPEEYYRVFVAGQARSGSMWTYNITRCMLVADGYAVIPDKIPPYEKELIELSNTKLPGKIFCIKTHGVIQPGDGMKVICPRRNILDSALSHIRFMGLPINLVTMTKSISTKKAVTKYYQSFPGSLQVEYGDIVNSPLKAAMDIHNYLHLTISDETVGIIVESYRKSNVQKLLDNMKGVRDVDGHYQDDQGNIVDEDYCILNIGDRQRVYHFKTAFQSGHITNTKDDEWRQYFTTGEQEVLLKAVTSDG